MNTTIVGMLVLLEVICVVGLIIVFSYFIHTLIAECKELNEEAEEAESLALYVEGWKNTGVVD